MGYGNKFLKPNSKHGDIDIHSTTNSSRVGMVSIYVIYLVTCAYIIYI